jgi:serine/threonine-protein kinase
MLPPTSTSAERRYRLIAEIGRGGMAEVYLAVTQGHGGFNKLIVVKKTLQNLALRPEILSMFMDEARLAARMNHPNVVQTYELGEEDGRPYIAMEFLDGQPYSRILARLRGRPGGMESLSFAHHLRVLIDVLSGLHHAHELRDFDGTPLHVVHRDVTPHNVFVTYDGSIKVVDFGIAKAQDSSSNTVTGEIKGKVSYMSPEQVRGEPLDRRSDVFAVGVLLWEAVAGRRMWADLPDVTVLHEMLQGNLPPLREAAPGVPDDVLRVVERALALDREQRYPTALAMQRDLDELAYARGLRVDAPEVGQVVAEMFAEERRRVRSIIESQIGSMRWTGENPAFGSLPVIAAGPKALPDGGYGAAPPELARPGGSETSSPTHTGAALSMRAQPPSSRRLVVMMVGVAVAAIVASVLAVVLVAPRGEVGPRAAAATTDEAAPSAEPSAAAAVEPAASVSIRVRVSPPEATILLDGERLGRGSYEGEVQRSEAPRVLRVEAEGYEPKEEKVRLTSNLMMSISLQEIPAAAPSAATTPPAAPVRPLPPAAPQRPLPPPRTQGPRGIDAESPYR